MRKLLFSIIVVSMFGCSPKTTSETTTDSLSLYLDPAEQPKLTFDGLVDEGGSLYKDSTANSDIVLKVDSAISVVVLAKSGMRMPFDTSEEPDPCDVYYWYQVALPDGKHGWIHGSYYLELSSQSFPGGNFKFQDRNYSLLSFTTVGIDVADDNGLTGCTVQVLPVIYEPGKKKINFIYVGPESLNTPDISCDRYNGRLSLVSTEGGNASLTSVDSSLGIKLNLSVSFQEGGGTASILIGTQDGSFQILSHTFDSN